MVTHLRRHSGKGCCNVKHSNVVRRHPGDVRYRIVAESIELGRNVIDEYVHGRGDGDHMKGNGKQQYRPETFPHQQLHAEELLVERHQQREPLLYRLAFGIQNDFHVTVQRAVSIYQVFAVHHDVGGVRRERNIRHAIKYEKQQQMCVAVVFEKDLRDKQQHLVQDKHEHVRYQIGSLLSPIDAECDILVHSFIECVDFAQHRNLTTAIADREHRQ